MIFESLNVSPKHVQLPEFHFDIAAVFKKMKRGNSRAAKLLNEPSTHLSGDMKLVHHLQFVVHLDAALHQLQFAVAQ